MSTEDDSSSAAPTDNIGNCQQRRPQAGRSNSRGLEERIERTLIRHIEEAGGIPFGKPCRHIQARHLCKGRSDIYGPPGSDLREKVRQRIKFLRGLTEVEYYRHVANLGIELQPGMSSSSSDSEASSSMAPSSMARSRNRRQSHGGRSLKGRPSSGGGVRSPPPKQIVFDSDDEFMEDTMSVTTSSSARKKGKKCRHMHFLVSFSN